MNTKPIARRLRRIFPFTVLAVAGLTISLPPPAHADSLPVPGLTFLSPPGPVPLITTSVITNGGFENVVGNNGISAPLSGTVMVPTWTSNGQEWVFLPNPAAPSGTTADTTGASDGTRLKGPGTGNTNGLTLSPDGGTVIMNGVMAMGQLAVGGIRLIDPTNFTQYASPSKGGIS